MQSRLPNNGKDLTGAYKRGGLRVVPEPRYGIFEQWIGDAKRVLYIGRGGSDFIRVLHARQCSIVAIEFDAVSAEESGDLCDRILVTNEENLNIVGLVEDAQFDAIVLDDSLALLRRPDELLGRLRALLSENGTIVVSAANFMHGAIRLALLAGSFDPQLLQSSADGRTRLFTLNGLQALFAGTGLCVEQVARISHGFLEPSHRLPAIDEHAIDRRLIASIASDPESSTLEYVVRAKAQPPADVLPERLENYLTPVGRPHGDVTKLEERRAQLAEELQKARNSIAERDEALTRLEDVVAALEHEKNSLEGQRDSLVRQRDEFVEHNRLLRAERDSLQTIVQRFEERISRLEGDAENATRALAAAKRSAELLERDLVSAIDGAARREAELLVLVDDAVYSLEASNRRDDATARYILEVENELERAWSDLESSSAAAIQSAAALEAVQQQYLDYEKCASEAIDAARVTAEETLRRLERLQHDSTELDERERYARARNEALEKLVRETENEQTRLTVELESSQKAVASLRERLQTVEQRLLDQTNGLISATQAESEKIATLIETVQTSKFWALKRWMRKLVRRG